MCVCQKKMLCLSLMKLRTPRTAAKCIFWKFMWLRGWLRKVSFNVYSCSKQQAIENFSTINGTAERMDLNHIVISIYQKIFIQTKAVQSVLKWKLGVTGYNVHAALSSTTNIVVMAGFNSFIFGFTLRSFQLYLWIDNCTFTVWTMISITFYYVG